MTRYNPNKPEIHPVAVRLPIADYNRLALEAEQTGASGVGPLILSKLQEYDETLAALKTCYTRIFNIAAEMDALRDPAVTAELNDKALEVARVAIARVKNK